MVWLIPWLLRHESWGEGCRLQFCSFRALPARAVSATPIAGSRREGRRMLPKLPEGTGSCMPSACVGSASFSPLAVFATFYRIQLCCNVVMAMHENAEMR